MGRGGSSIYSVVVLEVRVSFRGSRDGILDEVRRVILVFFLVSVLWSWFFVRSVLIGIERGWLGLVYLGMLCKEDRF